jgi:hypothetical protein
MPHQNPPQKGGLKKLNVTKYKKLKKSPLPGEI